jgi:hypothetical protein
MREVGLELFRKVNGAYVYPSVYQAKQLEKGWWDNCFEGDDADSRQYKAVIMLLLNVAYYNMEMCTTRLARMVFTVAEIEERYRRACAMADALLRDADRVRGGRRFDKAEGEILSKADGEILRKAAVIYREWRAARYKYEMKFATTYKSKKDDGRERVVAIQLMDTVQGLFGEKVGYGIVRKLATVVTGREITRSMVQNWLTPVCKKRPKKQKADTPPCMQKTAK